MSHSCGCRALHGSSSPLSRSACQDCLSCAHLGSPHAGASVVGSHEPGFRVGKPWIKQYISHDSCPYRSASKTACSTRQAHMFKTCVRIMCFHLGQKHSLGITFFLALFTHTCVKKLLSDIVALTCVFQQYFSNIMCLIVLGISRLVKW